MTKDFQTNNLTQLGNYIEIYFDKYLTDVLSDFQD